MPARRGSGRRADEGGAAAGGAGAGAGAGAGGGALPEALLPDESTALLPGGLGRAGAAELEPGPGRRGRAGEGSS